MNRSRACLCPASLSLVVAASAATAGAQTTQLKHLGEHPGDGLGWSLALLDDLDGDGVRDVASGEIRFQGGVPTGGRVQVLSLRSGAQLQQWHGAFQSFLGATVARVGDHDGDGFDDLLIAGEPANPENLDARIVSPRSGATLLVLGPPPAGEIAYRGAAPLDDLTGDGVPELVVAWPGAYVRGAVAVLDGATGAVLHEAIGDGPSHRFGWTVFTLDDVDGDGLRDFAASTFTLPLSGHPPIPAAPGYVRLFSSQGAQVLATVHAPDMAASFGRAAALLGDVDGDGRAEWVAAADQTLYAFRTDSSTPLWSRTVPTTSLPRLLPSVLGPLAGGVDLSGDGRPDAAITYQDCIAPPLFGGCGVGQYVHGISGTDGSTLFDLRHPTAAILYGQGLALLEDLDGDGRGEVVASAPNEGVNDFRGTIRVSSPVDLPLDPDSDLYSVKTGPTSIQFRLSVGAQHRGQLYLLLGSFGSLHPGISLGGGVSLPLQPLDPWFVHTVSYPNLAPFVGSLGVLGADGTATVQLDLSTAQLGALQGTQAYHAALVFGPSGPTFASHAAPLSFW
jgi:hypothetical protein